MRAEERRRVAQEDKRRRRKQRETLSSSRRREYATAEWPAEQLPKMSKELTCCPQSHETEECQPTIFSSGSKGKRSENSACENVREGKQFSWGTGMKKRERFWGVVLLIKRTALC